MIKENINKIDYELKNLFENVEILEKSNRDNYFFEINATGFTFFKGEKKEASIKAIISKPDLMYRTIKWSYYTNPLKENSDIIERYSNIDTISNDIYEVVSKVKMESEYFESLDSLYELINESVDPIEKTLEQKVDDVFSKFGITEKSVESKFKLDGSNPEKKITYNCPKIKMSDKFNIESEIKSLGINYVSFNESSIKVVI